MEVVHSQIQPDPVSLDLSFLDVGVVVNGDNCILCTGIAKAGKLMAILGSSGLNFIKWR